MFSIRQLVAHLISIAYVSDRTCDPESCSCLLLHVQVLMKPMDLTLPFVKKLVRVRHYLCWRNFYVSVIFCVQETCTCPPLPVYKKLLSVRHSLCTKSCKCAPYPFFSYLSVSDNTSVWETQSAVLGCVISPSDISCIQTFNGI